MLFLTGHSLCAGGFARRLDRSVEICVRALESFAGFHPDIEKSRITLSLLLRGENMATPSLYNHLLALPEFRKFLKGQPRVGGKILKSKERLIDEFTSYFISRVESEKSSKSEAELHRALSAIGISIKGGTPLTALMSTSKANLNRYAYIVDASKRSDVEISTAVENVSLDFQHNSTTFFRDIGDDRIPLLSSRIANEWGFPSGENTKSSTTASLVHSDGHVHLKVLLNAADLTDPSQKRYGNSYHSYRLDRASPSLVWVSPHMMDTQDWNLHLSRLEKLGVINEEESLTQHLGKYVFTPDDFREIIKAQLKVYFSSLQELNPETFKVEFAQFQSGIYERSDLRRWIFDPLKIPETWEAKIPHSVPMTELRRASRVEP